MMKTVILFLAIIGFACTETNYQITKKENVKTVAANVNPNLIPNPNFQIVDNLEEIMVKEPYQLKFDVKKGKENSIDLIIKIDLEEGAYFASPFQNYSLKGIFKLSLGEEKNLALTDLLTENPTSKTVTDEFSNEPTKWVTQNTTYVQNLKLKTNEDFEVFGNLKFVIEPKCTLEEIPFKIYVKDGKLGIEENPDC